MADDAPNPPAPQPPKPAAGPPRPPAKPTAKTSSVPLKKETVRITLRAKPGEGAEGGGAAPAKPAAPSAPGMPAPPAGSKTIPLTPGPAKPGAPQVGKTTAKLSSAPGTQPLPKATQQLRTTGPVSSAPPSAALGGTTGLQTGAFEEDDDEPSGLMPLAIAAAVLALILLVVQMMGSDKVEVFVKRGDTPAWGVPEVNNPSWEQLQATGVYKSSFENRLPKIPE